MELSDIIQDIESTKLASIGLIGAATGALSRLMHLDEKIEKSSKTFFHKDKVYEKQGIKAVIATVAGLPSVDYSSNLSSCLGQGFTYIAEFRLAYEAGYKLVDKYLPSVGMY